MSQTPEAGAWRGRQQLMQQERNQNVSPQMLQMAWQMAQRHFNERQAQAQAPEQQQQQMGNRMATRYDGIPITEPSDLMLFNGYAFSQPDFAPFSTACLQGDLSTVRSVVTSQFRTPAFLHEGLVNALGSGQIEVARYLIDSGAPITRTTPKWALAAPRDQQLPLFELFIQYGWTVNIPDFYGAVQLPAVVRSGNVALLDWFLANGADPNLSVQKDNRDRYGGPDTDSCEALETAAQQGNVAIVQKLLNAGAKIDNGAPLYFAAGACPPGANPHAGLVTPSKEFDEARIPVMALLVENGARVNDKLISRHMTPQYPIVNAVMAGAVQRVKWLLSQGADPDLKGPYGSARDCAQRIASDEMKQVLQVQ